MSNNNFIIWSYLEHPIRVEETNTLSKTYTHRCEPSKGRHDNRITSLSLRGFSNGEPVAISFKKKRLLRRFAPRNDSWGCHYEPAEGGRNICLNVIARLPAGKPWQSQKRRDCFATARNDKKRDCFAPRNDGKVATAKTSDYQLAKFYIFLFLSPLFCYNILMLFF
jgi:hypothetical protein